MPHAKLLLTKIVLPSSRESCLGYDVFRPLWQSSSLPGEGSESVPVVPVRDHIYGSLHVHCVTVPLQPLNIVISYI